MDADNIIAHVAAFIAHMGYSLTRERPMYHTIQHRWIEALASTRSVSPLRSHLRYGTRLGREAAANQMPRQTDLTLANAAGTRGAIVS